jgi:hypothetical protein
MFLSSKEEQVYLSTYTHLNYINTKEIKYNINLYKK